MHISLLHACMVCFHTHSIGVELKKPGGPLAARQTFYCSHTWSGGTIYGSKNCHRWSGGTTYGKGTTVASQTTHSHILVDAVIVW